MKERDILLGGAMLLFLILFSCQSIDSSQNKEIDMIQSSSKDPHSYAMPKEAMVTHLDLTLNVNFNTKNIEGEAVVFFQHQASAKRLILSSMVISGTKRSWKRPPPGEKYQIPTENFGFNLKELRCLINSSGESLIF